MPGLRKMQIDELSPEEHLILARPVILGTGVKGFNEGVSITDKVIAALHRLGFTEVWIRGEADPEDEEIDATEEQEQISIIEKFQTLKTEIATMLADIMTEKDPEREMLRLRRMFRGGVETLMKKGALTKVDPDRPISETKVLKQFTESVLSTRKLEELAKICRDLLEGPLSPNNIDKTMINLSDNRIESSYLYNHMANTGLYFLATMAQYNYDLKQRGAVSSELKFSSGVSHEQRKKMLFFFSDEEVVSGALGAFIHDVGYLHSGMPDLLFKEGNISPEEHNILKKHVEVSMNMIQYHTFFDNRMLAKNVVENHHERLNGTGYPKNRKNFHVFSRLLGMIDCFDSLTTNRPWRSKFARTKVLEWLYDHSEETTNAKGDFTPPAFDRNLFVAFEKIMLLYENGEQIDLYHAKTQAPVFKCLIREQNPGRPDRPIVELLECYPDPTKQVEGRVVNLLNTNDLYAGETTDFIKSPII